MQTLRLWLLASHCVLLGYYFAHQDSPFIPGLVVLCCMFLVIHLGFGSDDKPNDDSSPQRNGG